MSTEKKEKYDFKVNSSQAKNFLEKVLEKIKDTDLDYTEPKASESKKWREIGKKCYERKEPKLLDDKNHLYNIYLSSKNDSPHTITYKSIKAFLKEYFDEYFNITDSKTKECSTDIGTVRKQGDVNDPENSKTNLKNIEESAYSKLNNTIWYLYTFGEKVIYFPDENDSGEKKSRRTFYIKERQVQFKDVPGTKTLKELVIKNDELSLKSENNYRGNYKIFTKQKESKTFIYLETSEMDGARDRRLRITLLFGETVNEIGIGTFSGIRDGGALFTGSALLVRRDLVRKNKAHKIENDCQYHYSFKHRNLRVAVQMLLEKRGRSYIKLPRKLIDFTIEGLKKYLKSERDYDRKHYESREIQIHRFDAFVATLLNSNRENQDRNLENLRVLVEQLNNRFSMKYISYGVIKTKTKDATKKEVERNRTHGNFEQKVKVFVDSNATADTYEIGFEHISQSAFFIFVLPKIVFKDEENFKLSSSFLELGYALALRKRIIILCTKGMESFLPNSIHQFENSIVKIIKGDVEDGDKLKLTIERNSDKIKKFIDENKDFERD